MEDAILFGSQHGGAHYDTVATDGERVILRKSEFARNSPVVAEKPKKKTERKTKNVRKTKNKK